VYSSLFFIVVGMYIYKSIVFMMFSWLVGWLVGRSIDMIENSVGRETPAL